MIDAYLQWKRRRMQERMNRLCTHTEEYDGTVLNWIRHQWGPADQPPKCTRCGYSYAAQNGITKHENNKSIRAMRREAKRSDVIVGAASDPIALRMAEKVRAA